MNVLFTWLWNKHPYLTGNILIAFITACFVIRVYKKVKSQNQIKSGHIIEILAISIGLRVFIGFTSMTLYSIILMYIH